MSSEVSAARHAAVAEQYRCCAALIYQRCLVMGGGNRTWAEDVMHDTFVRLIEHAPTLDLSAPLTGWLMTVAYRLCIDKLEHEQAWWRRVSVAFGAEASPGASDPPDPRFESEPLLERLTKSVKKLPARERAVITMKYVDDLRQAEIARRLGRSEGYISKLHARAMQRLRVLGWGVDDG